MSYGWRAFSLFGAGALFGLVASAVLFAPPELGNQPPPWSHWAREQGPVGATPQTAGAPAPQPVAAAPVPPAAIAVPATVEPAVVAADAAPTPPVAEVVAVSTTPMVKKRKVQKEEPTVDTSTLGAGPAAYPVSVAPEAVRPPPEEALPRSEPDASDPSR